ncbi:MAG TPA: rhodanese-like domain-containing protein [Cyclobacteriaceae bacterium]|jgi:rhodanese-related sulfurtransferase|nr:rhodanese-like domain-containing protein [Cyclobacteriaceae bacterium]
MKTLFLTLLFMPALIFAQQEKKVLTPQEFKMKSGEKSAVILDVRTPEEFAEDHIDKAVNKNVFDKDFSTYTASLDKSKSYFVYCLGGKRSRIAAVDMRKKGLTVYELQDGIEGWKDARLPVVK